MSSIFPEKIALYFASMNPLSAKIFADIQAVEESVKIDNNLSYNEKSKIIDKHLIYDVIRRNQRKQQQFNNDHHRSSYNNKASSENEGDHQQQDDREDIPVNEIFYDDPELDKNQVTALLTAVYPKKPEKYIYDDNSFYLDEHSEPFSYCTQSQAKYCELEKLVKNLPLPTSPPPPCSIKSNSKSRTDQESSSHPQSVPHREKQQAPLPGEAAKSRVRTSCSSTTSEHKHHGILNHEYIDEDLPIEKSKIDPIQSQPMPMPTKQLSSTKTKSGTTMLGFPILGFGSGSKGSSSATTKNKAQKDAHRDELETTSTDEDSNLPNQVQNLDLIAELQAKLKMNKGKSTGSGSELQHTPSTKVNKPKAPPPPPPGNNKKVPGTAVAVKVSEPTATAATGAKDTNKTKVKLNDAKNKTDNKAELKKNPDSTDSCTKEAQSPNTPVTDSDSKSNGAPSPNPNPNPKKMTGEEFTVDVSSPCRIAVKKTGFDFLDDW